ncbi:ectonucleoside triphosphate diphosphohydrolase 5-like [Venturia canescens]|uniref:ectonucleoside triphosphate diphosphohydrolase 5-like n=1 Tax=Venturia canescens TaxID=32260 RepID=UPI001C9C824E|nr:ectonucleoside triphosphate diphosphohydrolase 5-like [Venturia canescens]
MVFCGDKSMRRHLILTLLGGLFLNSVASPILSRLESAEIGNSSTISLVKSSDQQKTYYAVVIDAGSSGTRIHAFTFHRGRTNSNLILDNEFYKATEPGLSAYVDNPEDAAKSLYDLLAGAKAVIPKTEWSRTPFLLKATAGLRLLPPKKAERILDECKKLINVSGFLVTDDSVSILESDDEGIYGWLTVNYLSDRLSYNISKNTSAALDLGGGSTQVTYAKNNSGSPDLDNHIHTVNVFGRNISVYTDSYLGMGMDAARVTILTYGMDPEEIKTLKTVEVHSVCIDPHSYKEWDYRGQKFIVHGPYDLVAKSQKDYLSECEKIIDDLIFATDMNPIGLEEHEAYAFSGYFWTAAEAGLIDVNAGGEVTVGSFEMAAERLCGNPNPEKAFQCLDLKYVSALLEQGLSLEPEQKLYLYRDLRGHELSWALGAAFGMLRNGK